MRLKYPRFPRIRSLWRRLVRVSPAAALAVTLGALTVVFVGCLRFTHSGVWSETDREELAPQTVLDRVIRVRLLGRKPRSKEALSVTSTFTITDTATGVRYGDAHAPLYDATVSASGAKGLYLGDLVVASSDVLLTPKRDASIVLSGRTYRGVLRVQNEGGGLYFTNHLDIESYLRGVLRGELPRSFHDESFKAQCVAARTYAMYSKRFNPAGRTFDVYDDEGSQVYKGVAMEDPMAVAAVEATRGEYCVYRNGDRYEIFCTYYSSCCGGVTQHVTDVKPRDPDVPPLAGGAACNDCSNATHYRWKPVRITKADVTRRVVARYPDLARLGTITALSPRRPTPQGRVTSMDLVGAKSKATLIGEDFRLSIGGRLLKSTWFKIVSEKDAFVFTDGRGFGHGLGLCQYGMDAKARRGMGYKQILAFYYPGSDVKKIYEDRPSPV